MNNNEELIEGILSRFRKNKIYEREIVIRIPRDTSQELLKEVMTGLNRGNKAAR